MVDFRVCQKVVVSHGGDLVVSFVFKSVPHLLRFIMPPSQYFTVVVIKLVYTIEILLAIVILIKIGMTFQFAN